MGQPIIASVHASEYTQPRGLILLPSKISRGGLSRPRILSMSMSLGCNLVGDTKFLPPLTGYGLTRQSGGLTLLIKGSPTGERFQKATCLLRMALLRFYSKLMSDR